MRPPGETEPGGKPSAGAPAEDEETLQRFVALGRLSASVAHDFNNLLLVMTGHVELARRLLGEGHPASARLLPVLQAAERAGALTRRLLAFGRSAEKPGRLAEVSAVIAQLEPVLRRLLGPYVELEIRVGGGLGLVRADAAQLEQLLMNLVLNARDAMPGGGRLTIEAQDIEIAGGTAPEAPPGRYVALVVSDEGRGMDVATRARAFEPFFTTKPPGEGSGLGLALVDRVVREVGGSIRLDSRPDRGTRFRVYLPWAADPAPPPPLEAAAEAPGGRETVLLAEGSEPVREVTRGLLEALGYTVLTAPCAESALRLARERTEPIDLVLADAAMPVPGGGRLADELARLRPTARLLLMSGAGEPSLAKPFSQERLARAVRDALDGRPG